MSAQEQNKEIIRRFYEQALMASRENLGIMHEYFAADYVNHTPFHGESEGVQNVKDVMEDLHEATPLVTVKVTHIAAEGDLVFVHLEATSIHRAKATRHKHLKTIEPTGGESSSSGVGLHRMKDGKIVESWNYDNIHEHTGAAVNAVAS